MPRIWLRSSCTISSMFSVDQASVAYRAATASQPSTAVARRTRAGRASTRKLVVMWAPWAAASTTPDITSQGNSSSGTSLAHCRLAPLA